MINRNQSQTEALLAIDCGTQSVRALAFDLRGALIAKSQVHIEPYYSKQPGWAEQDPEVFWDALCQACQKLWETNPDVRNRIVGAALTAQRATVVNLDQNGKPLRPAIVWLDQRRTEDLPPVSGVWGALFAVAGMSDTVAYLQSEAEANWIATHQPQLWDRTFRYSYLSGYLTYKLVRRFIDSTACQVGYMPFDYKAMTWAKSWDWKWRAIPMDADKLVDLVPPGTTLGTISADAAEETGIPEGLSLIASAADKATEVLGAGGVTPDIGCLSYGTTATFNTTHTKYLEVIPLIPPYPAAMTGAYSLEVQIYRGYWMVNWFKHEFGLREMLLAEEQGVAPESLFDDLVNQVAPGSDGLVLQPYWSPGLRVPGPEAKGSVIGFSDQHTRAHIYRAILEGLAFALREGKERTEKRSKVDVNEIRVAGGGSQSEAAMQLTADVFNLPASRPHTYEASGLGAAINAAVGLDYYPDYQTAVGEMSHLRDTFEPQVQASAVYEELYQQVYRSMYRQLKPLYKRLQGILARHRI